MNISYSMLRCTIFSDVYMNILYCVESGKLDDHRAPTYCTTHICSSLHFNRLCSRVVIPLTSSSLHSRGNSADKLERENTQPKSDVLFPSRNDAFLFLCLISKQGNDLYVWIGALIIPSRTVNTGGSVHSCESPSWKLLLRTINCVSCTQITKVYRKSKTISVDSKERKKGGRKYHASVCQRITENFNKMVNV